jgi:hypothetical protein
MKRRTSRQPSREFAFLVKLRTLPPLARQDLLASLRQQSQRTHHSVAHHRSGPGTGSPRVRKKATRASDRYRDRDFWLVTATGERYRL